MRPAAARHNAARMRCCWLECVKWPARKGGSSGNLSITIRSQKILFRRFRGGFGLRCADVRKKVASARHANDDTTTAIPAGAGQLVSAGMVMDTKHVIVKCRAVKRTVSCRAFD